MTSKTWQRIYSCIVLAGLLLSLTKPGVVQANTRTQNPAAPSQPDGAIGKIEKQVLDEITAKGQTDFFIILEEQADLSPAAGLGSKLEKGEFVYNTLRLTADQTQKELRAYLDKQGVAYTPYYIVNLILVSGGTQELLMAVASRTDVAEVTANHSFQVEAEKPLLQEMGPEAPATVEPNLSFVNADDVWALGITGEGTVLAGNDTGLDWNNPAIQPHYRGWDGANVDHNYNWWTVSALGAYPEPVDGHGYGTLSAGNMVGDDGGGNQIGMAPGAKTVHCKNTTWTGSSQDSWAIECFEWDLAPWDLNHANPRPDLAPDVVNFSYTFWGSANNAFRTAISNLNAAGILVEAPAGNNGYNGCSTLRSPGDYQEVLTTGSVWDPGSGLPGTLSSFSSRGPSSLDGDYFPDVMAPGESIRSSWYWDGYSYWSGTGPASAHTAGLVGLMWSANPALRGMVNETMQIIKDTAVPLTGQSGNNCGGIIRMARTTTGGMAQSTPWQPCRRPLCSAISAP
jgi:subtilisin family serine protease